MDLDTPFGSQGSDDIIRSSIWHRDGTLVLEAETTQFCIHQGLLTQHSIVFRDLLDNSPNTAHVLEQVDGRPLVRLAGDSVKDVEHLLRALYDTTIISDATLGHECFPLLSAVLRLSTKYFIRHLRFATEKIFLFETPSQVFIWDWEKENEIKLTPSSPSPGNSVDLLNIVAGDGMDDWRLDLANLVEETHLLRALPLALYNWVGCPPHEIFLSDLSQKNKERVLHALHMLDWVFRGAMKDACALTTPGPDCLPPLSCRECTTCHIEDIMTSRFYAENHPLASLLAYPGMSVGPVCDPCAKRLKAFWHKRRDSVLQGIPADFMLGTWQELAQKDREFFKAFTLDSEATYK